MKLYLALMTVLMPAVMIFLGWYMEKHPPKKINHVFGYRTPRSKKSQAAWDFAQKHCGRFWLRAGVVSLPVTAIVLFFCRDLDLVTFETVSLFVIFVQLLPLLAAIPATERALKRQFGEEKTLDLS